MSDTDIPAFDKPIWKSLAQFYDRPWFQRVWVLQEDMLAQHKIYLCGLYAFKNDLISAGIYWLNTYQSDVFTTVTAETDHAARAEYFVRIDFDALRSQAHSDIQLEQSTRPTDSATEGSGVPITDEETEHNGQNENDDAVDSSYATHGQRIFLHPSDIENMGMYGMYSVSAGCKEPLTTLLRITRGRETSVTKDRIFAVLAIAEEADERKHGSSAFRLDYSRSTVETFISTVRFIIKHHHSLEVLKMVEYLPRHVVEELSWVPCWHRRDFFRSNILTEMHDESGYCAAGSIPLQMEERDDMTELALHGQRLDRITYVSNIMSRYKLEYGEQAESMRILDLWTDFQKNIQTRYGVASYPTGEDLRRVFAMTLIAGLDENGKPAGEDFWKNFLKQYGVEMEDDTGGHTLEQQLHWHAGFRDLQLHLLVAQIEGANREAFLAALQRASEHRRLFLTAKGYLGLGPAAMEVGDEICVLFGTNVPYVYRSPSSEELRSGGCVGPFYHEAVRNDILGPERAAGVELSPHIDFYIPPRIDNKWDESLLQVMEAKILVGHCYVHGMMHGEAVQKFENAQSPSVIFTFQ